MDSDGWVVMGVLLNRLFGIRKLEEDEEALIEIYD